MSSEAREEDSQVAFVTEFAVPGLPQLPDGAFERWPGLKSLSFFNNADVDSCRLLAVWESRMHFEAAGRSFTQSLGSELMPRWSGVRAWHQQATQKRTTWDRIKRGYVYLVTLVAVLGTLAALSDYYDALWGAPEIQLSPQEPLDVLVGTSTTVELTLSNVGSHVARLVLNHSRSDGSGIALLRNLRSDPEIIPRLPVGSAATVKVPVRADKAGRYAVMIRGKASSGLFAGDAIVHRTVPVRAWDPLKIQRPTLARVVRPTRAQCLLQIDSGIDRPDGLSLTAELQRTPGVEFEAALGLAAKDTEQEPDSNQNEGAEIAMLRWTTWPLKRMTSYEFQLVLNASTQRSAPDWSKTCADISVVDR
jgi:hypothetical protein